MTDAERDLLLKVANILMAHQPAAALLAELPQVADVVRAEAQSDIENMVRKITGEYMAANKNKFGGGDINGLSRAIAAALTPPQSPARS